MPYYAGAMRSLLRSLIVMVALLVMTTGCIDLREQVSFAPDGSGTYEATFLFDAQKIDALVQLAQSSDGGSQNGTDVSSFTLSSPDDRQKLTDRFGPSAQIEPATEQIDGKTFKGSRIRLPFASPDEFNALSVKLAADDEGSQSDAGDPLHVTRQGDAFTLTGTIPALAGDTDDPDAQAMAQAFLGDAHRALRLTFPGQVLAANADRREGQTYVWALDITSPARDVEIRWRPSGSPAASVDPTP